MRADPFLAVLVHIAEGEKKPALVLAAQFISTYLPFPLLHPSNVWSQLGCIDGRAGL